LQLFHRWDRGQGPPPTARSTGGKLLTPPENVEKLFFEKNVEKMRKKMTKNRKCAKIEKRSRNGWVLHGLKKAW
jgi:hypothetical protein